MPSCTAVSFQELTRGANRTGTPSDKAKVPNIHTIPPFGGAFARIHAAPLNCFRSLLDSHATWRQHSPRSYADL
ncbi:hypothetical protein HNR46_003858 [Haloferula luteola]|uniref:Uncharacterized protein n=1 Tax=Haloferula luteola TaxID=595692 RepID=A0A840V5S4_9BACT|nr:hypothetical protein [Haloferula luteola]